VGCGEVASNRNLRFGVRGGFVSALDGRVGEFKGRSGRGGPEVGCV
jgi:hypothetical protein